LLKRYEPLIDSTDFPKTLASVDDILDAFVLAVTAKLAEDICRLSTVCDKRHYDSKGMLMDIAFFNPEAE
jgi:predicted RNase H-like nuclease